LPRLKSRVQIPFPAPSRRHSQAVRRRSAKPLYIGSNPIAASNKIKGLGHLARSLFWFLLPFCYHKFQKSCAPHQATLKTDNGGYPILGLGEFICQ
jgi:hypothetical protein